jgi:putative SOS response-associated peptidase YedK
MCGRFWLKKKMPGLENFLDQSQLSQLQESFNIAPGQWASVIIKQEQPVVKTMKWGLIPSWSKTTSTGYQLINARSETLHEKKTFSKLLQHHRCLIPCSGFYEWQAGGPVKQPYCIKLEGDRLATLAGLWTVWQAPTVQEIQTFTIITTAANPVVHSIHERMPVIIGPEDRATWLASTDLKQIEPLFQPYLKEAMTAYPISTYVNKPDHNDEGCLTPIKK